MNRYHEGGVYKVAIKLLLKKCAEPDTEFRGHDG